MNQLQATVAIYTRFQTLWPGLSGSLPFVFDNDVVTDSPSYARVSVVSLPSEQHTLGGVGNRKWERDGMVDVKLYTPANAGRAAGDALVSLARQIFEGQRFGVTAGDDGVVCYQASVQEIRPEIDAQFWIMLVSVAFSFYEVL